MAITNIPNTDVDEPGPEESSGSSGLRVSWPDVALLALVLAALGGMLVAGVDLEVALAAVTLGGTLAAEIRRRLTARS